MIVTANKKKSEFVGNENKHFKKILIYNRHVPAALKILHLKHAIFYLFKLSVLSTQLTGKLQEPHS